MEFPIHTENLRKNFGGIEAVRGLNLSVPPQSVYGFLGPNGAGKSTTIRMILCLQRPTQGRVSLFGRPLETERIPLLRRIGSLVESPSLYLHLTGRENLEVHRRLLGITRSFIGEALAQVDLTLAANRLVRTYSSGMKQRLGLAQALLGNPELLVLDEPTNGLGPAGIHEIRALVRSLPKRSGVTVFLSSHLLSEIEQIATHLAIVSQGQVRFEGTPRELQAKRQQTITVEADQPDRAAQLLTNAGLALTREEQRILITPHPDWPPARINALLVQERLAVSELQTRQITLEDIFLDLTRA